MALRNKIFTASDLLPQNEFDVLQQYLKSMSFDRDSSVFSLLTQKDVQDKAIRNSRTIVDNDSQLLEFVKENIINKISEKFQLKIQMSRDFVTFIKYEKDGFFKEHVDFEKYKLNDSVEMHLIFCIEGPKSGGELKITKDGEGILLEEAKTKNCCVLFDKKMVHSAEKVLEGNKIIMTVDVLVNLDFKNYIIENNFKKYPLITTFSSTEFQNMGQLFDAKTAAPFVLLQSDNRIYYADVHSTYSVGFYKGPKGIMTDEYDGRQYDDDLEYFEKKNKNTRSMRDLYSALLKIIDYDDVHFTERVSDNFSEIYYTVRSNELKKFTSKITRAQITYIVNQLIRNFNDSDVEEIGASYHCNESNYSKFKVSIVGGFFDSTYNPKPDGEEYTETDISDDFYKTIRKIAQSQQDLPQ